MIGEFKTVLDSEFHVANVFFLSFFSWRGGGKIVAIPDYWGSGNLDSTAKDSLSYKQNLSGFSIMKDKNTDNIEERFVSF